MWVTMSPWGSENPPFVFLLLLCILPALLFGSGCNRQPKQAKHSGQIAGFDSKASAEIAIATAAGSWSVEHPSKVVSTSGPNQEREFHWYDNSEGVDAVLQFRIRQAAGHWVLDWSVTATANDLPKAENWAGGIRNVIIHRK